MTQKQIEELLRFELGSQIEFCIYTPPQNPILDFILLDVKNEIGDIFDLYCVSNGYPEIFCLETKIKTPIIFSNRYISFVNLIKKMWHCNSKENLILPLISEGISLKLTAELALRQGEVDFAVWAFIKSLTIDEFPSSWREIDKYKRDITEFPTKLEVSYIVRWFYGLTHEMAHLKKLSKFESERGFLSCDRINSSIEDIIIKCTYPLALKEDLLAVSKYDKRSILNAEHLQKEIIADYLSMTTIVRTILCFRDKLPKYNNLEIMTIVINELIFSTQAMAFFNNCKQCVSEAKGVNNEDPYLTHASYHVANIVRLNMQILGMLGVFNQYFGGNSKELELIKATHQLILDHTSSSVTIFERVLSGPMKTREFALSYASMNKQELLDDLSYTMFHRPPKLVEEIQHFCMVADSMGRKSKVLEALKGFTIL